MQNQNREDQKFRARGDHEYVSPQAILKTHRAKHGTLGQHPAVLTEQESPVCTWFA